ncbi:hypothetical protein CYB_1102 [Synechococcus sp. JA-2-3B'a(2-13)]|nr:hypothetical protein CYB_1102 [Synechococcus sp. JA-2-3B'a(2-13)]
MCCGGKTFIRLTVSALGRSSGISQHPLAEAGRKCLRKYCSVSGRNNPRSTKGSPQWGEDSSIGGKDSSTSAANKSAALRN